ncbi:hypothetical protein [uncultured Roseibium sp.]|uniref:hypothetical protein n=1 Tax=uncultured Roseibium sp. TaxID=1936171 RepID=UPI002638B63A|nr:hypothetical protein [uncultured Roseibium sp.]
MVEDALKSARGLHRLIMTVALVAIIFALSVESPPDKKLQKEVVDSLIELPFVEYEVFLADLVEEAAEKELQPIFERVSEKLDAGNHLIFGLDDIAEAFLQPIHVGKLQVDNTILSEVENASLIQLNALNGLDLDRDAQILVPDTDELLEEIAYFFSQHPDAGRRIDSISIGIGDYETDASSFLPDGVHSIGIYFDLVEAVRTGATPAFSATFTGEMKAIPNSSFLHWLSGRNFDNELVRIENGEVKFATNLKDAPNGFYAEKLGVLSLNLEQDIEKSSPASQSVSILGTNVPGLLVVFAAPLILFFLSYYFSCHTRHLVRIAPGNIQDFRNFAWLPLSLTQIHLFSLKNLSANAAIHRRGGVDGGLVELMFSAILLPLFAIALLFFRLREFGDLSQLQLLSLWLSIAGIVGFGVLTFRNIALVRKELEAADGASRGV